MYYNMCRGLYQNHFGLSRPLYYSRGLYQNLLVFRGLPTTVYYSRSLYQNYFIFRGLLLELQQGSLSKPFGLLRPTSVYGPRREKTCLWRFADNKGADQPEYMRSLISPFVIRFLESIVSKISTSEISIF